MFKAHALGIDFRQRKDSKGTATGMLGAGMLPNQPNSRVHGLQLSY